MSSSGQGRRSRARAAGPSRAGALAGRGWALALRAGARALRAGALGGLGLAAALALAGCSHRDPAGGAEPGPTPAEARVDVLRARLVARSPTGAARPVLGEPAAAALEQLPSGRLRAVGPATSGTRAHLELPATAAGAAHLADEASGVAVDFTLAGASAVPAEVARGLVLYAGGGPSGADVLHRTGASGTEDYLVFERRPAREEVRYTVDVSRAAGLRLVGRTLELLDAGGVPRLRVAPPAVLDAAGRVHPASLAVEGCAADTDPRAPWGRPVTPPGAASCAVRVAWSGVAYPAALDPQWATTATMGARRSWHTATPFEGASGRGLLVAGGYDENQTALFSAELYAPPPAAAFAATDGMFRSRGGHAATALADGRVLVTGGTDALMNGTPLAAVETYDPATGHWTFGPTMAARRVNHTATLLLGAGQVLIAGGNAANTTDAELYDPAQASLTPLGPMAGHRSGHTATLLPTGGKVLLAGGIGVFGTPKTAELYDPAAKAFTATAGLMSDNRSFHASALLPAGPDAGKVLVTGGIDEALLTTLASAELYDPATDQFTALAAAMTVPRSYHTVTALRSGALFLTGGENLFAPLASTELFFPATRTFSAEPSLTVTRAFHTATRLASLLLVTGGAKGVASADAEVFPLPCAGAADCDSGNCLEPDGFCCDTACVDLCTSCTAAAKGSGLDGVCGFSSSQKGLGQVCKRDAATNVAFEVLLFCDGKGGIGEITLQDCLLFGCAPDGKSCAKSCDAQTPCSSSGYCAHPATGGVCLPKLDDGSTCTPGPACTSKSCDQCLSGHCSDGFCCTDDCESKQCGSCEQKLQEGTCVAIAGAPLAPREACAGKAACAGSCDGQDRTACKFPEAAACGPASCKDGELRAALCDGKGACLEENIACGAYACNGESSCKTECASIADCALGNLCIGRSCVALADSACLPDGETVVSRVSGKVTTHDCAPFACDSGHCKTVCQSVLDCASHDVCDRTGACVPPPSNVQGGGCVCTSAGGPGAAGPGGLLAGLCAAAGLAARRRRKKG